MFNPEDNQDKRHSRKATNLSIAHNSSSATEETPSVWRKIARKSALACSPLIGLVIVAGAIREGVLPEFTHQNEILPIIGGISAIIVLERDSRLQKRLETVAQQPTSDVDSPAQIVISGENIFTVTEE